MPDAQRFQQFGFDSSSAFICSLSRVIDIDTQIVTETSLIQNENAVGQSDSLPDIMRHQQGCWLVLAPEVEHQVVHAKTRQRIKCCKWLVQQKQLRFSHQRPRQGRPLCFTTR